MLAAIKMSTSNSNTSKEKQHYVPKFYLRNFSYQENKKQIGIYNLKRQFYYETASLKDVACKPFFYGKDGYVEDQLSCIENILAPLIKRVLEEYYLPIQKTEDYWNLLYFIAIMDFRNPVKSKGIEDAMNELSDRFKLTDDYRAFQKARLSQPDPVIRALSGITQVVKYCDDLVFKLIQNKTQVPFITSDNPVIKYNQLLESKKHHGNGSSIITIGIQIFIALNSKTMLMLYDPWAYKVGNRKQNIIALTNTEDVENLNLLQFLNCEETIFFDQTPKEFYLKQTHEASLKFRRANQVVTIEYPEVDEFGNKILNSKIFSTTFTECKTKMNLSFLKFRDQAKLFKPDGRLIQPRPNFRNRNYGN